MPETLVDSERGLVSRRIFADPDLYRLEMELFRSRGWVAFYIVCLVLIGSHLWHGFASAFESLGADNPRYTPRVLILSKVLAVIIAGGFISIPLWVYFGGGRS